MNKRNKQRKLESKRRRKTRLMHDKKADRETSKMQHEINKLSANNSQIVKHTSERELRRIELSGLPKEEKRIEDIRKYRKQRRKRLGG
tara:strand:- start:707 stop:970 length:264 start_codon:yes stop_codon:yes gene_type:complete